MDGAEEKERTKSGIWNAKTYQTFKRARQQKNAAKREKESTEI